MPTMVQLLVRQRGLCAALLASAALPAFAQIDVVEAEVTPLPAAVSAQPASLPDVASALPAVAAEVDGQAVAETVSAAAEPAVGELFYQVQLLQEELQMLRGQLEEQQNQITELKRQRLDDYMSLDKRLAAQQALLGKPGVSTATTLPSVPATSSLPGAVKPPVATAPVALPNAADERAVYKAAYALVKEQRFGDAKTAFGQFIKLYPNGRYTANAYYWQGELLLLEQKLDEARLSFETLLASFPAHDKVPDAMFKLAKVKHLQGDDAGAKTLLQQVVSDYGTSGKSAVKFAQDYLQRNF